MLGYETDFHTYQNTFVCEFKGLSVLVDHGIYTW